MEKVGAEDGIVHLIHVSTDEMVADILTKPLSAEPFEQHVGNITDMNIVNAKNSAKRF